MDTPEQKPIDFLSVVANIQKNLPSKEAQEAMEAEWQRERDEEAERRRKASIENNISRSGIPKRHYDFVPPMEGAWYDQYKKLKGLLGKGFLMVAMGNRGTGKTQLGTCLIQAACYKGRNARYVKAIDIFIALRGSFRKDGITEIEVVDNFVSPDLLVIDALEERGETPFEDRLLNHIIDKRYDNMDDTLLITNQTPQAFADSVGSSIISRIHETGDKIICDWESFRKKPLDNPPPRIIP